MKMRGDHDLDYMREINSRLNGYRSIQLPRDDSKPLKGGKRSRPVHHFLEGSIEDHEAARILEDIESRCLAVREVERDFRNGIDLGETKTKYVYSMVKGYEIMKQGEALETILQIGRPHIPEPYQATFRAAVMSSRNQERLWNYDMRR